ncbi:hypothetical protein ACWDYH_31475 [Nocardia goodfellowii]
MEWFLDFWRDFWPWWTTARASATAAVVAAGMAILTGTFAIRTFRHNRKATQRTTRPMMIGTLKMTGEGSSGIEVTNVGPSIARDVQVTFDPPLPTHEKTKDGLNSMLPWIRRRFAKPVGAWAPGYTVRSEFVSIAKDRKVDEDGISLNSDGVLRETVIVFRYRDDDGNKYSDQMSLDPMLLQGETWSEVTRGGKIVHDAAPYKLK